MQVSDQFVNDLFANSHFNNLLNQFNLSKPHSYQNQTQQQTNNEAITSINQVLEDINTTLYNACKQAISTQCNHLYQSNSYILTEIQALKSKISALNQSHHLEPQISPQENPLSTSIFFDPENDLKQIRKNINCLESQLQSNHKSLIQSFQMYEDKQDNSRQNNQLKFDFEFKLNQKLHQETKRIEEQIKLKTQKFQTSIQQRVQQLKKTITKVVQAMNDPSFWVSYNNPQTSSVDNHKLDKKLLKIASVKEYKGASFDQSTNENEGSQNAESLKKVHTTIPSSLSQKKHDSSSGSNKTIQSLNKSFNFGKTKIKSLFGFKTSTQPPQFPLKISQ